MKHIARNSPIGSSVSIDNESDSLCHKRLSLWGRVSIFAIPLASGAKAEFQLL